ncbi:dnaJ homolog subfamily C member 17-like [Tigriopus californicus]|uniref:dnaJ homolog subfamily C member 17-like n=1 Tax=Tigriopus californicus TaxID=6832 RepID=UPI0027DAA607|nr:dnaJ homolog subfamily C member 17-like [Tigriopus californicus]|eukprot:TCALIF_00972-PA protein Name:"Similar to DNAJC17 DnaJ homolog subfamily C member 17 (Bos taurus)" AED:0.13 eAED:0.13 QI:0/-1/0/1/-1/1/1/0/322
MAKLMERIKHEDLYELLGILPDCSEKDIKRAYRQKALKCHPDKNPDDPLAAQAFHRLSDAYEVLTDPEVKKAYDQVLRARQAHAIRNKQLDAKRRKLKDDLEARERQAQEAAFQTVVERLSEEEQLAREIERLRREGSRVLEEEQERLSREIRGAQAQSGASPTRTASSQAYPLPSTPAESAKLKVRWKDDAAYDQSQLRQIFAKYGDVGEVIVLGKPGKMSGLVEMHSRSAAELAAQIETGFRDHPLKVKLITDTQTPTSGPSRPESAFSTPLGGALFASAETVARTQDFESLVMRKLRQEEERKRLIREIEEQDARDAAL